MIVRRFLAWMKTAPAEARAEATGALARAWLYSEMDPHDRAEAEQALTVALDDPSPWVRQALAEAFGRASNAPQAIVAALAHDQSDVAAIVLSRSPLFDEAALVDHVATGDALVQTAIAMRAELPAPVCAAVAEVAELEAVTALAANASAAIPAFSLGRMVERHGDDPGLRDALMARDDLPTDVRMAVVLRISEAMASAGDGRAERQQREASERAVLDLAARADDAEVTAMVRRLRSTGRLTAALVLAAVVDGDLRLPAAAFVDLTGMNRKRVDALLSEGRGAGFAALCRKAGLPETFVPVLEAALAGRRAILAHEFAPVGAARRRRIAAHTLRDATARGLDPEGRAMLLLRRLESEAAREEARLVTQALVAAQEAESQAPLLLGPDWRVEGERIAPLPGPAALIDAA
ncbi:DUF2336 domain-containing protein [Alsobacter sp. R-9]